MKRYFALLAVLFALAASGRAQSNCSQPVVSGLYNYTQTPPVPPAVGAVTFPDVEFCNGQSNGEVYTVQVFENAYCQNTQTYNEYAQSTRTTFGDGVEYCSGLGVNLMCDPRIEPQVTTATSPTDYNRFYIRVYDAIVGQYCGTSTTLSRQDFWQCLGQACQSSSGGSSPPDCGCCSGPIGAKLLGTPQAKDVKLSKGKPQTSCYYDCACCQPACSLQSPIIFDVAGAGFSLTDAAGGVLFDISGTGRPVQIAWTVPGSQNAFLCLPDANGTCNNGKDLFGNFTPQPPSPHPNGWAALDVYDQPANGGNGDGIIDARDAIYSKLRLWIDANHDGISQPNELFTLPSLGVNSISLSYKWDGRIDQYGNILRYHAQVNPGGAPGVGRMAYDVFFMTLQSGGATTVTAKSLKSCPPAPRLLPEAKDGVLK